MGKVRAGDLENGSSNRHSILDFDQLEGAGSDADHHAGRLAVYSRGPKLCIQEEIRDQ